MIIVTGGAGFIGSNLVKALNEQGHDDILVVDDLSDGRKIVNLSDCHLVDYIDKDDFIARVASDQSFSDNIEAIYHQGACSKTTEQDGRYMMQNNYEYSKTLLHYALKRQIPFIYASSASVYGVGDNFREKRDYEHPLNVYAFSKYLFDQYVRKVIPSAESQIVGLRYFNVYGPRESHKEGMASVIYHFNNQLKETGKVRLFEGSGGYANGEQKRDFIYVGDVVKINLWFAEHQDKSGIVNVGTGRAHTFNEAAQAVVDWHGKGEIEYIPFPDNLKGRYQHFTEACIRSLRTQYGFEGELLPIDEGAKAYLDILNQE